MQKRNSGLKIVLFGLPNGVGSELVRGLSNQTRAVYSFPCVAASDCLTLIEELGADLVFCTAEPERYWPLLKAVKLKKPGLPIILVSRCPETSEWLEALEAGASDYCAPPFEAIQIQWMLEAMFKSRPLAA
jgi:DNA-binding NtrC family response regulator